MFRRLPHSLPPDPVFPTNLSELGYFLNEHDQIRQIKHPEQKFVYRVNANERINEVYKGSMNTCVKDLVHKRFNDLGFETVRLPLGAGSLDNHVPVYVSPGIKSKKRAIVLFPDRQVDPLIFSYRAIGDESINEGSVLAFVRAVLNGPTALSDEGAPGVVIANPSQLYWYRGGQKAVSWIEWLSLPRTSAVHEPYHIDPVQNSIPGNKDSEAHVAYMFDHVLSEIIDKDAKIDIIGLEWTGKQVIEYLAVNWPKWSDRVGAVCFTGPQHKVEDLKEVFDAPDDMIDFLSNKCRAYFLSPKEAGATVEGRAEIGCNAFASGENLFGDAVILRCWASILDHFNAVHTLPNYEEPIRYAEEEIDVSAEEIPNQERLAGDMADTGLICQR